MGNGHFPGILPNSHYIDKPPEKSILIQRKQVNDYGLRRHQPGLCLRTGFRQRRTGQQVIWFVQARNQADTAQDNP